MEAVSRFKHDVFLIANSQQQVQKYINEFDYTKISAFIVDDYEISINQKSRSPLIGLYTAFKELQKLGYKKVFVLSCDNPLVKFEVIEYIINHCEGFDCCIPKWKNNFLEPLFAIYPIGKAYETSLRNLKQKHYKLTKIIAQDWKINYISIEQYIKKIDPNLFSFKNINKLEDVKILESLLNKTR